MSTRQVSDVREKICDACGLAERYEMVDGTHEDAVKSSKWFRVGHMAYSVAHDQFVPMIGDACSLECLPVVGVKISVVTPENQDKIDMNSLRAGSGQP